MSLRLVVSWFADGRAWPEHPGPGTASLDAAVVGPQGLLDHLETRLGLGAPANSAVKRIALYRRKLEAAGEGRFWEASFAMDSWSTTRELLSWRDEIVEAGWDPGAPCWTGRLADLAAAESAGPDLPAAFADRLRNVVNLLALPIDLSSMTIELVDCRDDLPVGWRTLLNRLTASGVAIRGVERTSINTTDTDLRRLLGPFDKATGRVPLTGDGTAVVLAADTEISAAEAVAAWLSADMCADEGLVFVLGSDSSLLDQSLRRAGLPRIGVSRSSPHRSLLQVLPLTFALAWDPPDPEALLDFLLLPVMPIPRRYACRLAACVAEEPGIGGARWRQTFDDIATKLAEDAPDATDAERAERIAVWRSFVEPKRHDPTRGMPASAARAIADRVADWAHNRWTTSQDPLFMALASCARDLTAAIEATGSDQLDRLLVERMIEQVVGPGATDPTAIAEAAPWRSVTHPGAIWGPARTVVWWNFADPAESAIRSVWSRAERNELAAGGAPLDDPAVRLRLLSSAWERPVHHAVDQIIFVRPATTADGPSKVHPLWHTISAGRDHPETTIAAKADVVLETEAPMIAGRRLSRATCDRFDLPRAKADWSAPAGAITPRPFESATSLSAFLGCPFQWTLKHVGRLESSTRRSIAGGETLMGTLAHRLAEEIFEPGAPPSPEVVMERASVVLESLLPEMAASLLLPGAARDLAAARRGIPEALAELSRFLVENGLRIVTMEQDFADEHVLGGETGIRGAIDLVAEDPKGRRIVIDLKWQGSDRWRRQEIAEGNALQLAVYAKHLAPLSLDAPTGYFMLRQKRFVTGSTHFRGATTVVQGPDAAETWLRVSKRWKQGMEELECGRVRAPFELRDAASKDFSDPILMTPPKCKFCDFQMLCGGAQ